LLAFRQDLSTVPTENPVETTLLRTNSHSLLVGVNVSVGQFGNPFSGLNPINLQATAAATLYGTLRPFADPPQINNQLAAGFYPGTTLAAHLRVIADGVKTEWDAATYLELANLHNDAGALVTADRLRICVNVNGRTIQRIQSDVALTAATFRALLNVTMRFQIVGAGAAAYGNGTVIDIFMFSAAQIVSQVVGAVPTEGRSYDFLTAATLPVTLSADRV
jgi:hypothetical protein